MKAAAQRTVESFSQLSRLEQLAIKAGCKAEALQCKVDQGRMLARQAGVENTLIIT